MDIWIFRLKPLRPNNERELKELAMNSAVLKPVICSAKVRGTSLEENRDAARAYYSSMILHELAHAIPAAKQVNSKEKD